MNPKSRNLWILLLICVWAFALRAWFTYPGLSAGRFYDERFNVENIHHIITSDSLAPANAYYQSFSYLPHVPFVWASDKLYQMTGWEPLRVIDGRDLTPTGYLILRWLQAVIGTATIVMTFLIGRRIFDPGIALWGSFLLAAVPWHVWQSSVFKPDAVMLLTATVAFFATLRAVETQRWQDDLLVGIAIGLTVSSKLNGALIALPLILATLLIARHHPKRLLDLMLAGAASIVTFLLLHPLMILRPEIYRRDLSVTARDYERKGQFDEASHFDTLKGSVEWLTNEVFHGPVLGTLLFGAVFGLAISLARSGSRRPEPDTRHQVRTNSSQHLSRQLLLSFPPAYAVCYSALTTNLRGWHNWMILTPFTSLILAWMFLTVWRLGRERWSGLRLISLPLAINAAAFIAWPVHPLIYEWAVPQTHQMAEWNLRQALGDLDGRVVYQEDALPRLHVRARANYAAVASVPSLAELSPTELQLADAELFTADRLRSEPSAFYQQRWESFSQQRQIRVKPSWFSLRGPELRILLHPWQAYQPPRSLPLKRDPKNPTLYRAVVPPDLRPHALTASLWLPTSVPIGRTRFRSGQQQQPLHFLRLAGPNAQFQTIRFRLQPKAIFLSLRLEKPIETLPQIACGVFSWRQSAETAADPSQRPNR